MKPLAYGILLVASTLVLPVLSAESQDQDHQTHHPEQQLGNTAATLQKADEKIAEMAALQEKAEAATSDAEKKNIQAEQMKQMQECMSMMNMMRQGMPGMMKSGEMMKPDDMMMRQQVLEKRMDMMQMMMQMMMSQSSGAAKK